MSCLRVFMTAMLLFVTLASLPTGCVARDSPVASINAFKVEMNGKGSKPPGDVNLMKFEYHGKGSKPPGDVNLMKFEYNSGLSHRQTGKILKAVGSVQNSVDIVESASKSTNQVALRFNDGLNTLNTRLSDATNFAAKVLGPAGVALTTIGAVKEQVQLVRDADQAGAAMLAEADKWRPIVNAMKEVVEKASQQAQSNARNMKEQATHMYDVRPSEAADVLKQAQEEFDQTMTDLESNSLAYFTQPVEEMERCSSQGRMVQTEYSGKWWISQWWSASEHTRKIAAFHQCVAQRMDVIKVGVGVFNADLSQKIKSVADGTRSAVWGLSSQLALATEEVVRATATTNELIDGHLADVTNTVDSGMSQIMSSIKYFWQANEEDRQTKHEAQMGALSSVHQGLTAHMRDGFDQQEIALRGIHGDLRVGFTDLTAKIEHGFGAQEVAIGGLASAVQTVHTDLGGIHGTLEQAREGIDRQGARLDDIKGDTAFTRGYMDAFHRDTHMGVEGVREQVARLHEKVAVLMHHDCDDKHRELLNQVQQKDAEIADLKEQLQRMRAKDLAWQEHVEGLNGKVLRVTELHNIDRDKMRHTSNGTAIVACIALFLVAFFSYYHMWTAASRAFFCMCVVDCFFSMRSFPPLNADGIILTAVLTTLTCLISTVAMHRLRERHAPA